ARRLRLLEVLPQELQVHRQGAEVVLDLVDQAAGQLGQLRVVLVHVLNALRHPAFPAARSREVVRPRRRFLLPDHLLRRRARRGRLPGPLLARPLLARPPLARAAVAPALAPTLAMGPALAPVAAALATGPALAPAFAARAALAAAFVPPRAFLAAR